MEFKDSIGVFPNSLSNEFCDYLIQVFNQEWDNHYIGIVGSGGVDLQTKSSRDFNLMNYDKYSNEVSILTNTANQKVDEYVSRYKDVPNLNTRACVFQDGTHYPVWQIQFYKKDEGHFKQYHTDGDLKFANRRFAVMFYLNDVDTGGETEFPYWDLKIKPTKGTMIVWPAPWPWIHAGHIPKSNDKYIVTSWLTLNQSNNLAV